MAQQVFAYILHKGGVADDTALELVTAAGKLDPEASVTAVVLGSGADLEAVCAEVAKVTLLSCSSSVTELIAIPLFTA